jgi:ABC-type multidrug transport system fused ATPase/permease subunit
LFGADVFGFVLYGSILTALNPLIIVFLLVTAIISVFITRYAQIYEHKNKDNWTLIDRKLWYLLDKSADFAAGKDIRMYNMSGWFERLFGIQLNERTWWLKRVERKNYLANVVDGLLVFIRDGAAYSYLIYLTLKGSISVADFTLYFGTVAGFSTWLSGITNEITQLSHLSLDISDVRDYLDLPERNGIGSEFVSSSAPSLPYEIELEHVTFQYPGSNRSILNDLNLKIQPGEKVALVGVNGAGKSTLVKLLCGLYQPHSGRVFINGNNSLDYNPDQIFQLFGVVFQEIHVLPVSIARNIATDCNVPVNVERVMECLRLAGLEEKVLSLPQGIETPLVKEVNEAAIQFSGGELQKLLLARSLYKDAPILILDEPTAALDPISENELYLRYNDLTANKTSVFISHRLTSTRFCDRIVFLSDGNIAETGTHEELMELNGQYAKMYKIQSHYYQERIDEMDGGGLLHEFQ